MLGDEASASPPFAVRLNADALSGQDISEGRAFRGHLNIAIDRDGAWYYEGSLIARKELVCLFASALRRDRDGCYWLATPREFGRIDVADVPFVAVELFVGGSGCGQIVSFRTNVDQIVSVDTDHPLRVIHDPETGEPSPYVMVRDGLEARLTRSVFYQLVALGVEETSSGEPLLGVWSGGQFYVLGKVDREP